MRGIDCHDCVAELSAVAIVMELEMASVEANHASIRRLQTLLSTQTHTEQLSHGSAEYLLRKFRSLGIAPSRKAGDQSVGAKAKAKQMRQAKRSMKSKQRRRRHQGGAWRAFIRKETLGSKGRTDFAELGVKYRSLSAHERDVLRDMGRCAKRQRREVESETSSLGAKTRRVEQVSRLWRSPWLRLPNQRTG